MACPKARLPRGSVSLRFISSSRPLTYWRCHSDMGPLHPEWIERLRTQAFGDDVDTPDHLSDVEEPKLQP